DFVDLPIPGNDDGIRSIERVVHHLADAVAATRAAAEAKSDEEAVAATIETAEPAEVVEAVADKDA
ncbi:MAG: 30S ribosomal protein S2, partial [Pirellulaceae bacterium]|nr:30S ribosomal protein S2 [Pirellulaceae bacterium]